jgi:hypothetical protein
MTTRNDNGADNEPNARNPADVAPREIRYEEMRLIDGAGSPQTL